jgi:hypothetical protein
MWQNNSMKNWQKEKLGKPVRGNLRAKGMVRR